MRLYRIPNPWDYHGDGGYLIQAENAEDAISKLSVKLASEAASGSYYADRGETVKWDQVTEVADAIYEESGCDC